jgi:hypothetical protein
MTGLQLSIIMEVNVQMVNYSAYKIFANVTKAQEDPHVRFLLDNTNPATDFFTTIRQKEISEHINWINILRTALLACKSSIGILAFIFSLIIPYFSFNSFKERYVTLK